MGRETLPIGWPGVENCIDMIASRLPQQPEAIVGISKGGLVPAALLADALDVHIIHTICVARYAKGSTDESTEVPRIYLAGTTSLGDLQRRTPLVIIDDICDEGYTLLRVHEFLGVLGIKPEDYRVVTLCARKWEGGRHPMYVPDVTAMDIPEDKFVIFPWERREFEHALKEDSGT